MHFVSLFSRLLLLRLTCMDVSSIAAAVAASNMHECADVIESVNNNK